MVLRIEDLDPQRSKPEYAEELLRDLAWLGLDWDEGPDKGGPHGPYVQSKRLERYDAALARLSEQGLLYPCYCTRKELRQAAQAPHAEDAAPVYLGTCRDLSTVRRQERDTSGRKAALRLRCPPEPVRFTDLLHGEFCVDPAAESGDFALQRGDGVHAYQLAVVVDDAEMGINLVVRGDDLLDSTPAQAALFTLLGHPAPTFLHFPLLVDETGTRLSKRHGSLELAAIRERGVRPQAVVGWLAARAGLLPEPVPVAPPELCAAFDPIMLPRQTVTVSGDITQALLSFQ